MSALRGPAPRKLVLIVIDGLAPSLLERAIETGAAPTLALLRARDGGRLGTSVFPSLTPVCLSAIATGLGPGGSNIPHMQWFHRGEGRFVEYGSSFMATLQTGTRQAVDDSMVNLNQLHLSRSARTLFELVEDQGKIAACVNFYVWRGRVRHEFKHRWLTRLARRTGFFDATYGPTQLYFGDLFESEPTGAPRNLGVTGKNDDHAGGVARWLVSQDAFDFMLFYLPETDFASHRSGPDGALEAVATADRNVALMMSGCGGPEAFLERYSVIFTADHGQSAITQADDVREAFTDLSPFRSAQRTPVATSRIAVSASNRAAHVTRLDASISLSEIAARLSARASVEVVAWREEGTAIVDHPGGRMRFTPQTSEGTPIDEETFPNARERLWSVLGCVNSGEVVASATPGFEFADAGGQDHVGGGSHGSLHVCDSLVPIGSIGVADGTLPLGAITDIAPLVARHFGARPNPRET